MFTFEAAKYPTASGVYIMKGEQGTVFYVGKAKNLRSRLRSYFSEHGDSRPQIQFLLKRVCDIETIVTDTEKEALILENTLIKKIPAALQHQFARRQDLSVLASRSARGIPHAAAGAAGAS